MIGPFAKNQEFLVVTAIKASLETVSQYIGKLLPATDPRWVWAQEQGVFSFDDCFTGVPPAGAAHRLRVLIFSPVPDQFALFTANLEDGWSSLAYLSSRDLRTQALTLKFCSDTLAYPARSLTLYEHGRTIRRVHVLREDKWLFYQEGEPIPQEDTSTYGNRLIRTRLSNEQLAKLATRFGVNLETGEELVGPGVIFEQDRERPGPG
jgi:hypothetical protein